MAVKSKTQLQTDISASTFAAGEQVILDDIVDSYENVFPQMTTVQRDALTPTTGQIIYNTDNDRYEYWNGTTWFGIGQDLSTPLVVKIDISSAELLALDTVAKTVAAAPGIGYAIVPISCMYRYTYGSVAYTGSYNIGLKNSSSSSSNIFLQLSQTLINSGANRSGSLPANTGTGIDAIVENDALELKASAAISTGDGTLTVWVTYTIIAY